MSAAASAASIHRELATVMLGEHPDAAASTVEGGRLEEATELLVDSPAEGAASVLRRLTPDRAARVLEALPSERLRAMATRTSPNRLASLFARMEGPDRERCLEELDPAVANELRELIAYPADTAGALMDPRVVTFRSDATVREVTRRLRTLRERRTSDIFVVGDGGLLLGQIPLETIVLSPGKSRLDGLIEGTPVSVQGVASRDEIVECFETQRIHALPVVDFEGALLGVLRHRDIVEAAQREATANAVTMVGASDQERALSTPWFAIRKRQPWLQINLLTAFLAAAVVGLFEETIASVTALAVLLPVVAGQSGNTGAQALAVTMRGLALREIRIRHAWQVVTKESFAGMGNGLAVATTTSLAVYLWSQSPGLAAVIGVSMILSMTLAGLSGAAIPMILTALKQDPAQSSSIVLTTVTDIVGFFSFLGTATLFMSAL